MPESRARNVTNSTFAMQIAAFSARAALVENASAIKTPMGYLLLGSNATAKKKLVLRALDAMKEERSVAFLPYLQRTIEATNTKSLRRSACVNRRGTSQ
jgi:hypothetical protein